MLEPKPVCKRKVFQLELDLLDAAAHRQVALRRFTQQLEHGLPSQLDSIAIEEPLQLWLNWFCHTRQAHQQAELSLTMRTPGQDLALVLGFLFSQGIIAGLSDLQQLSYHPASHSEQQFDYNQIDIELNPQLNFQWAALTRHFASYSSCGLCGASSVKALALQQQGHIDNTPAWLDAQVVYQLPTLLQQQQKVFQQTGSVHGAGLFANGQWLAVAEDIGRHNAVDKVIGQVLLDQQVAPRSVLVLSGRVSFELMQKAVKANIPVVLAVGAPSSLALKVAQQFNITLLGFVKAQRFNVYHAPWRIVEGGKQYES
ncbi:formate dehydrogenase accessory sulfurtransferase FdhD [Agarivorans sp.]|uniref:formate dehydrogenase accessory sulfurtransferase FdhD n=1 Tax=Agarivorans sp. TaxID=1872412 RepID=UPI003D05C3B5